jgi:hypothetical protein
MKGGRLLPFQKGRANKRSAFLLDGCWAADLAEVSLTAEPVEKLRTAISDNFATVKNQNQQLTGRRKPQNAQVYGFLTASLSMFCFQIAKRDFAMLLIYCIGMRHFFQHQAFSHVFP